MNLLDALKQVTTSIKTWVDENKVAKVSGKGLSTNDYTTEDKNKVANMANGLVVLDGKLYLTQDGVPLENTAVTLPSGSGSGDGTTAPKLASITMLASAWQGSENPWSQEVTCNGVSINSKLDLQPTPTQIIELQDAEISLMAVNSNGVVVVYAIGAKPDFDLIMDVLITEIVAV